MSMLLGKDPKKHAVHICIQLEEKEKQKSIRKCTQTTLKHMVLHCIERHYNTWHYMVLPDLKLCHATLHKWSHIHWKNQYMHTYLQTYTYTYTHPITSHYVPIHTIIFHDMPLPSSINHIIPLHNIPLHTHIHTYFLNIKAGWQTCLTLHRITLPYIT